jgi:hypothetical protein
MKNILILLALLIATVAVSAQDAVVTVNAASGKRAVSPYLYGRNNSFANSFGTASSASDMAMFKEAGLRFARENGGNNATKYNWRRKISSHPDWYNNVYDHDWDALSKSIVANVPSMQVMWAFQLIGKTASNKNNNFNDWAYNKSQWWSGCAQNLAGGGVLNTAGGSVATKNGDPTLYTMDWPADSTTAILNHWFGTKGIGLNSGNFVYWSMDNEPEIWNGTHDDVMPTLPVASAFMDKYFAVAKKARALYPGIKLCGPVCANEWQWYKWGSETLKINGTYYCWFEYFLKRVADEQKATGIRLLDVVDIHWYPGESAASDILQLHRIFYDKAYVYPGANGIKTIAGGWDTSQTKEYIFQRISDWIVKYFGENSGITIGLSESGISTTDANVNSVLYASMLGTFANNGVEYFTPWTWNVGMWETLHLFSRYAKNYSVSSVSTLENTVSAYTTVTARADSMTVVLVNRDQSSSRSVKVNISDFQITDGSYQTLQLASLSTAETFKSHSSNALKPGSVNVVGNVFTVTLPALSTTAVLLKSVTSGIEDPVSGTEQLRLYPNPATDILHVVPEGALRGNYNITIYNESGKTIKTMNGLFDGTNAVKLDISSIASGLYFLKIGNERFTKTSKFTICRSY